MILDTLVHGNQTVHWKLLQQCGHDLILFTYICQAKVHNPSQNKPKSWLGLELTYYPLSNFEHYLFVPWHWYCNTASWPGLTVTNKKSLTMRTLETQILPGHYRVLATSNTGPATSRLKTESDYGKLEWFTWCELCAQWSGNLYPQLSLAGGCLQGQGKGQQFMSVFAVND